MQRATLKPLGHGGAEYEVVRLSRREREILRLVCTGLRTKVIATRTKLTTATVDRYIDALYRALGLGGRNELMVWGLQHPQVMIPTTYVDRKLHAEGCPCGAIWCTAMRLATAEPKSEEPAEQLEPTGT